MPITSLDVFFRTQLPVDAPHFFNRITNIAFAPLQYLVGQKKYYQSLQGKITPLPTNLSNYSSIIKKVSYVFAFILAVFLTPIGIATRVLSFLSPNVKEAYSIAFLSQLFILERTPSAIKSACAFILKKPDLLNKLPQAALHMFLSHPDHKIHTNAFLLKMAEKERIDLLKQLPPQVQAQFLNTHNTGALAYLLQIGSEYDKLMPHLTVPVIEAYNGEKPKKDALDEYLTEAIRSLENLDKRLNGDRDGLESWLTDFLNNPCYSLPFTVAKEFEKNAKVIARANPGLWEKFISLRQSCNEKISAAGASLNEGEIKSKAHQTLLSAFKSNDAFFKTLGKKLDEGSTDVGSWLEDQTKYRNYHYPFYTHPQVLEIMQKSARENLTSQLYLISTCQQHLEEKGLRKYTEEPPQDHMLVNTLMEAIEQLDNIARIKDFIKTQTA